MNDYFHLTEKKKTIEAKCSVQHLSVNRYVKTNYSWIMNALEDLRFLPTIDVYSTLQKGFLQRLFEKQEPVVEEYLGVKGKSIYTQCLTRTELMHQYNIEPLSSPINQDCHQEYFVSPHWAGVCGIEERTVMEISHRKRSIATCKLNLKY